MSAILAAPAIPDGDTDAEPELACYVCGNTNPADLDRDWNRDPVCLDHLADWAGMPDSPHFDPYGED